MRCDDVTRELSAPGGRLDPSAMATHLASCPPCAAFAARAQNLDRLWDATRPPLPPPTAFETLWARVERPAVPAAPRRPSRRAVVAQGLACAASLLVTALLLRHHALAPPRPGPPPTRVVQAIKVEIVEGQIVLIPVDGRPGAKVVQLLEEPAPDSVAPDIDALNAFEAMAPETLALR